MTLKKMGQRTEDRDVYIQLLTEAKNDLLKPSGITYEEFRERFKKYNIKQHPEKLYRAIYDPIVVGDVDHHMGIDAYFRLLEYQELQLALQNSRQAKSQARFAIWVTAIFGLIQCVLAYIQIFHK